MAPPQTNYAYIQQQRQPYGGWTGSPYSQQQPVTQPEPYSFFKQGYSSAQPMSSASTPTRPQTGQLWDNTGPDTSLNTMNTSNNVGTKSWDWGGIISAVAPTAISAIMGMFSNEPDYPETEEYQEASFEHEAAMSAEDRANRLAIAEIQAAAMKEAAAIKAKAAIKQAKIGAQVNIAALREKSLADKLAARIKAKVGNPEVLAAAQRDLMAARAAAGQLVQQGYQGTANVAASFRR